MSTKNRYGREIPDVLHHWVFKYPNLWTLVFLSISVPMTLLVHEFSITTQLSKLQPIDKYNIEGLFKLTTSQSELLSISRCFYVIDSIWSTTLVVLILTILFQVWKNNYNKKDRFNENIPFRYILAFAGTAWTLDQFENLNFYFTISTNLGIISILKIVFYTAFLSLSIYFTIRISIRKKQWREIVLFVKSSALSLLLITMLLVLLTMVEQGGIMVLDMFWHPWNLLYLFILLNFCAIVISHYPSYYSELLENSKSYWHKFPLNSKKLFGIIHYQNNTATGSGKSKLDNILRRSLGTILYLVWIYVLLYSLNQYHFFLSRSTILTIFSVIAFVVLCTHYKVMTMAFNLSRLGAKYQRMDPDRVPIRFENRLRELQNKMQKSIDLLITGSIVTFLLLITLVILCCILQTSRPLIYWITIFIFISNAFLYILFRESRTHLMYFLDIDPKWQFRYLETYEKPEVKIIRSNKEKYGNSRFYGMRSIGKLSNHIYYLIFLRIIFLGLLLLTLISSIFFTTYFNPIIYLLFYFTALIYLLSTLIQHFIYYAQDLPHENIMDFWHTAYKKYNNRIKDTKSTIKFSLSSYEFSKKRKLFLNGMPICIIVFAIIAATCMIAGNNLHRFKLTTESVEIINLEQFQDNFIDNNSKLKNQNQVTFSIASFGGGLKANYWTLNLLDRFERELDSVFFNATTSMSGVSGGAMGLACYPFIYKNQEEHRKSMIDDIGKANILSVDVSYILFQDFIREILPFDFLYHPGSDRSHRAMEEYYDILNYDNTDIHEITFRDQWKKLYEEKGYYPALIMNTTSTNRSYGYSISLANMDLPGGINLIEYKENESLTYFDASSTVNRFAFMSPAARVPKKGHFVDGGYFENSGLLSTRSFLREFFSSPNSEVQQRLNELCNNHYIISIINGKGYWIRYMLDRYDNGINLEELSKESNAAEIPAILNTITGTDMLPTYLIDDFKRDNSVEIIPIHMPLRFDIHDIEKIIGGKILEENRKHIDQIITVNDSLIMSALNHKDSKYNMQEWGIVQPTLARLLSMPDMEYQRSMVRYHALIDSQFQKIKSLFKN